MSEPQIIVELLIFTMASAVLGNHVKQFGRMLKCLSSGILLCLTFTSKLIAQSEECRIRFSVVRSATGSKCDLFYQICPSISYSISSLPHFVTTSSPLVTSP